MRTFIVLAGAATILAGCSGASLAGDDAGAERAAGAGPAKLSLTRLDCGHAEFKDMNAFFSDRPGVYPPGPGKVTDSCYLIRHGSDLMIWDTGFPASARGKPVERGPMTASIDRTLAEQLAELGIRPEQVDLVGISHLHGDHIGQAAQFAGARLVIGKGDFEQLAGKPDDSFQGWRGTGRPLTLASGDIDVFGDGSIIVLHLPGHTPDHLGLLVKLKSGPVLLTGDLYHSAIARQKRAMPGFNTSREQTLQSMDRFEELARRLDAKVVIQHEPADIALLPAFPEAAR